MQNFDWEGHYKSGGKSGDPKDYEIVRGWKHQLIRDFFDPVNDSIIDVGCGDLQIWEGFTPVPKKYTGIDISQTIIDKNIVKYPDRKFICSNATISCNILADVVICFDMLWHVMDYESYYKIITNLAEYSDKYIMIYTWCANPYKLSLWDKFVAFINGEVIDEFTDGAGYQRYWDFEKVAIPMLNLEFFELLYTYQNDHWKIGKMYVFRKRYIMSER